MRAEFIGISKVFEENGRVEGESECRVAELPDDIAHEIESFGEDVTCPICHGLLVGLNLKKKSPLSAHIYLSVYLFICL